MSEQALARISHGDFLVETKFGGGPVFHRPWWSAIAGVRIFGLSGASRSPVKGWKEVFVSPDSDRRHGSADPLVEASL
jgi:hypothetical protein